jgi:hypothetical protein
VTEVAFFCISGFTLVACGSPAKSPNPSQSPAPSVATENKQPVFYTGKNCLSRIASAAARWQPDAMPVHMESNVNAESTERKIHGLARHLRLSEAWNVAIVYLLRQSPE